MNVSKARKGGERNRNRFDSCHPMAWQDTMNHAREYKRYAHIYDDTPVGRLFDDLAERQGFCAAALHEMLLQEDSRS